jgi:hypothetical protein
MTVCCEAHSASSRAHRQPEFLLSIGFFTIIIINAEPKDIATRLASSIPLLVRDARCPVLALSRT